MTSKDKKKLRYIQMKQEVEQWKKSGVGTKRFCKDKDFSVTTFRYWINKFRAEENSKKNEKPERVLPMVKLPDFFTDDSVDDSKGYQMRITIRDVSVELGNDFSEYALRKLLVCLRQV